MKAVYVRCVLCWRNLQLVANTLCVICCSIDDPAEDERRFFRMSNSKRRFDGYLELPCSWRFRILEKVSCSYHTEFFFFFLSFVRVVFFVHEFACIFFFFYRFRIPNTLACPFFVASLSVTRVRVFCVRVGFSGTWVYSRRGWRERYPRQGDGRQAQWCSCSGTTTVLYDVLCCRSFLFHVFVTAIISFRDATTDVSRPEPKRFC